MSFNALNREAFEKYMQEVQNKINALDEKSKLKAQDTLNAIYDNYGKLLLDRISSELAQADEARAKGDRTADSRHLQLANIYKSILENHIAYGPTR
jgi:hypothetical protein